MHEPFLNFEELHNFLSQNIQLKWEYLVPSQKIVLPTKSSNCFGETEYLHKGDQQLPGAQIQTPSRLLNSEETNENSK